MAGQTLEEGESAIRTNTWLLIYRSRCECITPAWESRIRPGSMADLKGNCSWSPMEWEGMLLVNAQLSSSRLCY